MENSLEPLYALIRDSEGLKLKPYLCPAGIWTCGWGSTGHDVVPGVEWTLEYADHRLVLDAADSVRSAKRLCPRLEGDALCAIADFVYNLGAGRLQASTLRKRINAGDLDGAVAELMKWNKGGGKPLAGLTKRRAREAVLLRRGW